jgi:hypothetical protein
MATQIFPRQENTQNEDEHMLPQNEDGQKLPQNPSKGETAKGK